MLGDIMNKSLEAKQATTDAAGTAWEKTVESKDQAGTYVAETTTVVVDKASEIAQSTQETAIAGKDVVVEKSSEVAKSTQETAVAGKDVVVEKASEVAKSTQETAVAGKEKTGEVLQTTGETIMNAAQSTGATVMNAAQGATETVKNTLGMGGGTATTTPVKKT